MSKLGLHLLKRSSSKKTKKRIGRGNAGTGTYCGRGIKGQRARSGGKSGLKRLALSRRIMQLPKIHGFTGKNRKYHLCNIKDINKVFNDGDVISPKSLLAKKLIKDTQYSIKILGTGKLDKKLVFKNCKFSHSVKIKIEQSGGTIQ